MNTTYFYYTRQFFSTRVYSSRLVKSEKAITINFPIVQVSDTEYRTFVPMVCYDRFCDLISEAGANGSFQIPNHVNVELRRREHPIARRVFSKVVENLACCYPNTLEGVSIGDSVFWGGNGFIFTDEWEPLVESYYEVDMKRPDDTDYWRWDDPKVHIFFNIDCLKQENTMTKGICKYLLPEAWDIWKNYYAKPLSIRVLEHPLLMLDRADPDTVHVDVNAILRANATNIVNSMLIDAN